MAAARDTLFDLLIGLSASVDTTSQSALDFACHAPTKAIGIRLLAFSTSPAHWGFLMASNFESRRRKNGR